MNKRASSEIGESSDTRVVAVIGAGYVGLPTAAVLARFGHRVTVAESEPVRLSLLQEGNSPIVEEGLEELLREGLASRRLRFVDNALDAVKGAAIVFLCVPTPQGDDGSADLSFVEVVAGEIHEALIPGAIVVNKSTVPVGTAQRVAALIGRDDVSIVSNPEFLREGTAVSDSLHPDRIVVGADNRAAAVAVAELFAPTHSPVVVTDTATSETIKYASNAFLATKLSFVNAIAGLCEVVGADVKELILGLGYDKRIGFEFMTPGPGWGGSCLPKDTAALTSIARSFDYDFALLEGAIATNDAQFDRVIAKLEAAAGSIGDATIAVWGLTFKANTDDRRCSPAVDIARRLVNLGANVRVFDPTVVPGDSSMDLEGFDVCPTALEATRGADVLALLTEWKEFRDADFAKVAELMNARSIVDARNLLDPHAMRRMDFTYTGIGRP